MNIKKMQTLLNLSGANLTVDGDHGPLTTKAYNKIGFSYEELKLIHEPYGRKFVVFLDAGHGGISPSAEYKTRGKRADHEGLQLHIGKHYYEGVENRIVAELVRQQLAEQGVETILLHDPYFDNGLTTRKSLVSRYIRKGYYGVLVSIHSDAYSSSAARGFSVFSDRSTRTSEEFADVMFSNFRDALQDRKARRHKDRDFTIITDPRNAKYRQYSPYASCLIERGFHTNPKDCALLVSPEKRRLDATVIVDSILQYRPTLDKALKDLYL